jgi:predicted RNA binding protein YcfA (HicA-like mRNA interferase family)
MNKLPVVSGTECIKVLGKIGFVVQRQRGSHITLVCEDPANQVTVPNHREVARGTLRATIRQAGLIIDEFIDLL